MNKILTQLVVLLLKQKRIKNDQRVLLINAVLKNLGAFPLTEVLEFDTQGNIHINGKKLNSEQETLLRESAAKMRESQVYQLIHNQVLFKAITQGVHQAVNNDMVVFSKAAIWWGQQEDRLLAQLTEGLV